MPASTHSNSHDFLSQVPQRLPLKAPQVRFLTINGRYSRAYLKPQPFTFRLSGNLPDSPSLVAIHIPSLENFPDFPTAKSCSTNISLELSLTVTTKTTLSRHLPACHSTRRSRQEIRRLWRATVVQSRSMWREKRDWWLWRRVQPSPKAARR